MYKKIKKNKQFRVAWYVAHFNHQYTKLCIDIVLIAQRPLLSDMC